MKIILRAARWLSIMFLAGSSLAALAQNTASVTSSVTNYSAGGGNVTFTVSLGYTTALSALDMRVVTPSGWKYVSTAGTNVPQTAPSADDLGNFGFDFLYSTVPTSPASFTFTVSYPPGMTGDKLITGIEANFTNEATSIAAKVTVANITIMPAPTPPAISTQPANQTVTSGQNATFTVAATGSPVPTFSWQKSTDAGANWTPLTNGGRISGASTATLLITGALTTDAASYRAIANNTEGNAHSNAATLTVNKANQTITFGTLAPVSFGDAPVALAATASSGAPVSYASSNTAVATISGSTVTILSVGNTNITASQTGTAEFNAAPDVVRNLIVNKAAASITLGSLTPTYDGTPKAVTATTSPASLPVDITYAAAGGTPSATAPTNVGTYAVFATINHPSYSGIVTGSLVISKATQTITFGALSAKTFNDPAFTLSATTNSPLSVGYVSSNPAVATISGNTVTLVGAGTTTITASQGGDLNYLAATSVPQVLTVNKATATITLGGLAATFDGTAKSATATTAPTGLTTITFTYAVAAGSPSATAPINAGTYTVVATLTNANYAGTATGSLVIAKAPQTITFADLPSRPFNDPDFTLTGTSTSGLPLVYTSSDPTVAAIIGAAGNVVDLIKTGSTTITATQPESDNYLAATPVARVLDVLNAGQIITFAGTELTGKTFGNAPFALTASASSGLSVAFASSNTGVATISGGTLTITGAGNTTITASQAGNANFASAASITRTMTVAKASAPVVLGGLTPTYDGTAKAPTVTTTPAGLTVVLAYNPGGATAPINAGTYAVTATINEANYVGTAAGSLVIAKAPQTITFPAIAAKLFGSGSFALGATASSNLPVTYTSSVLSVATISGGNANVVGLGDSVITANQAGNANFLAATAVTRTLTVNPVAPVINSPLAVTAIRGRSFLFQVTTTSTLAAFSATGLPAGLTINSVSGVITGTPTADGVFPVSVTASNITNPTGDTKTLTITVNPPPPIINSPAAATGRVGVPFTFTVQAVNMPTGSTYAATGLPSALSINASTGVISGTPAAGTAGQYTVVLSATNTGGTTTSPLQLTIEPALNAPTFTGNTNLTGKQNVAFTFTPAIGGAPFTGTFFTATGLPTGIALSSATATGAVLSGTPLVTGAFAIVLTATNAGGSTAFVFNLTINPADSAPIISSASTAATKVGSTFTFQLTATGTPAAASYAVTGLPALGLSLNPATGLISGPATAPGTLTLQVRATSTAGTGPQSILVISVSPSDNAPVITSSPVAPGRVGDVFTYNLAASGSPTGFLQTSGTLPAGLAVNLATGAITGTPTQVGQSRVWFAGDSTTNGRGLALEVLFNIAPASTTPVITSNGTAAAQVGQSFQYVITATNGPDSFTATGLPAGLSLAAGTSGVISGIPTASGSSTVTLTATKGPQTSSPKTLTLTIAPAPATPVITSALAINGRVGTALSYTFTASENATSFVGTKLPAGLTLDPATGALSGSPTESGLISSSVRAGNNAGLGASATITFNIAAAATAPSITSAAAVSGKVGATAALSYQTVAAPGPITAYAITGTLPLGLAFNTSTGALTGRPAESGLFTVQLTATNEGGTSAPQSLVLNIAPADNVPVITSPAFAFGTVGATFTPYTITAVGTAPFLLDAVRLPDGLAVNPSTGVIVGTPTTAGTFVATLVGSNSAGTGPFRDLTFIIQPAETAPVITSVPSAAGQVGTAFSYSITATQTPTGFEVLGAPAWMTVNSGTGAIAGTPAAPGAFKVTLLASNTSGTSNPVTLNITIAASPNAPVVTSSRADKGKVQSAFSYQITALVPTGAPAVTAYVATGLPSGLALNAATGLISGTPVASGQFEVTLLARSTAGDSQPVTLILTIQPNVVFVF